MLTVRNPPRDRESLEPAVNFIMCELHSLNYHVSSESECRSSNIVFNVQAGFMSGWEV